MHSLRHLESQCRGRVALINEALKQQDTDNEKLLLTANQFADKIKNEIQAKCNEILAKVESSRQSVLQAVKTQQAQEVKSLTACLSDIQDAMNKIEKAIASLEELNKTGDASVVQTDMIMKSVPSADDAAIRTRIQYECININTWKTDLITWQKPIKDVLTKTAKTAVLLKPGSVSRLVVQQRVTSAEHKSDLAVGEKLGSNSSAADVLSVSSTGLLAVGSSTSSKLSVYRAVDSSHVATIDLPEGDKPFDASWTRDGNIVYTCNNKSDDVIVISQKGQIVSRNQVSDASCLSMSADGTLYLASSSLGVFQSTDNGLSWSFVFKPLDRWKSIQIIKVASKGSSDEFWSLDDCFDLHIRRLRVYNVEKGASGEVVGEPTSREVFTTLRLSDLDGVDHRCRLAYDGSTVFLANWSENSVHALPLSGKGECQLLSARQLANNRPCRVGVDGQCLYLGLQDGTTVSLFNLHQKFA